MSLSNYLNSLGNSCWLVTTFAKAMPDELGSGLLLLVILGHYSFNMEIRYLWYNGNLALLLRLLIL